MTRREYLSASVVALFSAIIAPCTKDIGKLPIIKKLVILNTMPEKAVSSDQIKVLWLSENISFVSVYTKIGTTDWELIAEKIDSKLGEFVIVLPSIFSIPGNLSIKITDGDLEAIKPRIPKQNAYVIETSAHPELVTVGGMKNINISGNDVFVKRQSSSIIKCFSSACTHSGCPISFIQSLNKFNCSCHGSEFDANGAVIQGPAGSPLNTFVCETLAAEKFRVLY